MFSFLSSSQTPPSNLASPSDQGKWYRQTWNKQYAKNAHKYIEEGSLPSLKNLKTLRENFQSMSSTSTGNTDLDALLKQFDDNYAQYLKLTNQLTVQEDEYNQILVRNNEVPASIRTYLGMVVKDPNGTYYYITKYGHARKYPAGVWETRDQTTCSNTDGIVPEVTSDVIETCLKGPDMNMYEPCKQEGSVVRNGSAMEYKWVDAEGQGRVFQSELEYNNNQSCPAEYTTLATENYTAIRVVAGDSIMTPDKPCSVLVQDKDLQTSIINTKQQIIDLLHSMLGQLSQIQTMDDTLTAQLAQHRQALTLAISNLVQENKNMDNVKSDNSTLKARWNDIVIQERMEYYQYMGVAVVGAVVTGVLLHQFFSKK